MAFFIRKPSYRRVIAWFVEYFSEEDLRVLNSCKGVDLEICLVEEAHKSQYPLFYRYRSYEKVIPELREFLDEVNELKEPLCERTLRMYCGFIIQMLFKPYIPWY